MLTEEKLQRIAKELDSITREDWAIIVIAVTDHLKNKRKYKKREEDLLESLMIQKKS